MEGSRFLKDELNLAYLSSFCFKCATMVHSRGTVMFKKMNSYDNFAYKIDALKNVVAKRNTFYMVTRIEK